MSSKHIIDILYEFHASADIALEDLAELIADENPSVVRCKDRVHYWTEWGEKFCRRGGLCYHDVIEEWFCPLGERE